MLESLPFGCKISILKWLLGERSYIEQLEEYVVQRNEEKVYKLHKALHGLKHAPRTWYIRIDLYLVNHRFK